MSRVKVFILLLCLAGITLLFRTCTPYSKSWLQFQDWAKYPAFILQTKSPPTTEQIQTETITSENQSLCSCPKCLTEDEQLVKYRLDFSQPFLSGSYNLSQDDFKWWQHLQNEERSLSTFQATVDSLFKLFPPVPDMLQPNSNHCRTCAVVGNSANLKGSNYGKLIDSHDIVFRMNFGPVKGFEKDIGTKTTHRAMYPESAMDLDDSTHLVLFAFKIMDLEWLLKSFTTGFYGRTYAPVIPTMKANKSLVMVVNPAFMRYAHKIWLNYKPRYPSTGFMTLILSLHICDEVRVFGFGADSDGNWSHYWQKLANKQLVAGVHPGTSEYEVILQLAKQEKITFYKGL